MSNIADRKLFVGGLPPFTTQESLYQFFASYGDIEECKIIMDRQTRRSKGYGFVLFRDPTVASAAAVNGFPIIDGKRCNCNLASLNVKPDEGRRAPKRPYGDDGMGGGAGMGGPSQDYSGSKRMKVDDHPRETYIQFLAREKGEHWTPEQAKQKLDSLSTEPREQFKFFLEFTEIFKNLPDYEQLLAQFLSAARVATLRQAEADGILSSDDAAAQIAAPPSSTAAAAANAEDEQQYFEGNGDFAGAEDYDYEGGAGEEQQQYQEEGGDVQEDVQPQEDGGAEQNNEIQPQVAPTEDS